MVKGKINTDEIVRLARDLFHAQYDGHPETWFDYLCSDSVYLGTGEPLLLGKEAIKERFQGFTGSTVEIIQEEYFPVLFSNEAAQVCGQITIQGENGDYRTVTRFTLGFRMIGGEIKLIHQHNSYEYVKQGENDALLSGVFYPIHRGYLVNTLYIVSIRRYEAELISGMSVPIPMQTYVQIKEQLKSIISKTKMSSTDKSQAHK